MEDQRSNGAGEAVVVDATAVEDPPVASTELVRRARRSEVLHPLDREQLVASFREYQELCRELLDDSDYQDYTQRAKVDGTWQNVRKRFKKKSAWRKLAAAFDLDVRVVGDVRIERDVDGKPVRAAALARAIAPSGRFMEGTGYCSIDEPRFERDRSKAENDLPATSETRAKNRAIADLLGTGEVSAEEISAGGAGEGDHDGSSFGPVVSGETKRRATDAAVRLCGGDVEQARGLWATIQAALDGYMPQAAATALLHAAGVAAAGQWRRNSSEPTSAPNQEGSRLRTTAAERAIGDGELANLIRVAAGSARIDEDRAAGQLDALLERVSEPVARQTRELIEMLHPAGGQEDCAGTADGVTVDFAAIEPGDGQAA